MKLRLLLDENIETDLARKLAREGHDTERVVEIEALGPGTPDGEIRRYARRTDRIIVTYDDHFADPHDDHAGVLYCPNQHLSTFELFRIITAITDAYTDREELPRVVFLSTNWL